MAVLENILNDNARLRAENEALKKRVDDLLISNNAFEDRARNAERELRRVKGAPIELAQAIEDALRAIGVGESG